MSIIKSSKNKDQLLLDAYRYRRANKSQVLWRCCRNDGSAVPNYSSSQRTVERKRKKQDLPLPRPTSFNDILIPDELKVTNGGDRFLLYDNEEVCMLNVERKNVERKNVEKKCRKQNCRKGKYRKKKCRK
jgi:hypothetical protein